MHKPMVDNLSASAAEQSAPERERRQRVLKKGTASYSNRSISVECLVRDLSSGGVKLQLNNPLPLPDKFMLDIPMDGITVECMVCWRKGDTLGAVFLNEPVINESRARQKIDPTMSDPIRRSVLRKTAY